MATGNSLSGNGFPSLPPRGGNFPALAPAPTPANARGEHFLPIPVPTWEKIIVESPSPTEQYS
jgi:hypothetical protein